MTEKVKSCPFCGGTAEISGGTVYCPVCEISFANERETGAEAIKEVVELWNARPIESAQAAEIARLRGNIEAIKKIVDKPRYRFMTPRKFTQNVAKHWGKKNDA